MESRRRRTSWLRFLVAPLIFLAAMVLYQSNGDTYLYTYDSAPNSLFTFNLLENHTLYLDDFRGGYLYDFGASYVFVELPNGRLTSIFPIGTALLAAPLYGAFEVQRHFQHQPAITSPVFERYRLHYEKFAANILAALAAVLMFFCARRLGNVVQATIATVFFAAGTEMWTIGSQALWQHGPINLVVLALTLCLFAALDARSAKYRPVWLAAAGIGAGFLPVIRPTAILFSLAAFAFVVVLLRVRSWPFVAGILLGVAPGLAWNVAMVGALAGGYQTVAEGYTSSIPFAVQALAALLISPSRGTLITTPLVVLAVAGAIRAARSGTLEGRWVGALATSAAAVALSYAFFTRWWGGTAFGGRYLTDIAAAAALALVYVIPPDPLRFVRSGGRQALAGAAFALLFVWCIGVQFVGANGEMESQWSAIPLSIDDHNERVWPLRDTQIERDARATYFKFAPPIATGAYLAHFAGTVENVRSGGASIAGETFATGQRVELAAHVRNDGSSPMYGYASGVWIGQSRVRLDVRDAHGVVAGPPSWLYVEPQLETGAETDAVGVVKLPAAPGAYDVTLQFTANRLEDQTPAQPPLRVRFYTTAGTVTVPR